MEQLIIVINNEEQFDRTIEIIQSFHQEKQFYYEDYELGTEESDQEIQESKQWMKFRRTLPDYDSSSRDMLLFWIEKNQINIGYTGEAEVDEDLEGDTIISFEQLLNLYHFINE